MSGIRCPECGGEAPGEARFCPHCGGRLLLQAISPLAAILVIVLAFIIVVFGFPLLSLIGLPPTDPIISAMGESTFLLVPLMYMLRKKVDVTKYIMFGSLRHVILGLGLGTGLLGVGVTLSLVLTLLLGPSARVEEANRATIRMAQESPVVMMLVMLLAGACEEFAFRGFLQNALRSRYSLSVALLGASLAFGLVHLDPQAIYTIVSFVAGLFLGYFYNRLRSYILVATAHAAINMISLGILLLA